MRATVWMTLMALLLASGGVVLAQSAQDAATPATATPAKAVDMVFMPKFLGAAFHGHNSVSDLFEQAHRGAEQAAHDLRNPRPLQYTGPTVGGEAPTQIEGVKSAVRRGAKAIMISNNSGDDIVPVIKAAHDKGIKVVSWDSPLPADAGADVLIAQVDFSTSGTVLADMALNILGADGGKFAILTIAPDNPGPGAWAKALTEVVKSPKYAKLDLVDVVYGQGDPALSAKQALALVAKHPDVKLIIAPDSASILAVAKTLQDRKLCDKVKVGGFGTPNEMRSYVLDGCVPQMALWSFVDFGYLTYYTAYLLATDAMKAEEGQTFTAGRLGTYTIVKDRAPPHRLRVVLGPWRVYDNTTIGTASD